MYVCLRDALFRYRITEILIKLVKLIKFHHDIFRVSESEATVGRMKDV